VIASSESRKWDDPPRWVVPLFALAAAALVPWVVMLVRALPSAHRAAHWDVAWAGFDVLLASMLVLTGVGLLRQSAWLRATAASAATLLVCDAWFDILGAHGKTERVRAVLLAVLAELPTAAVCVWIARRDAFVSE
jgi:hypothetical protein